MNKLAVFYEHIFEAASQSGYSVEEVLGKAKSFGIDLLECDHWRLSERKETRELFDRCGMGVSSIYEHFNFMHDSAYISAEKYKRLFDTAAYFGAEKVLCIPGFFTGDRGTQISSVIEGLSAMCEEARKYRITVTLEDFDDITSPCCRMEDIRYLMDCVPDLRYTFDTGNFRYCLEDAEKGMQLLRDRLVHVHCKDRSYDISNADADRSNGKTDLSGEIMYPAPVGGGIIVIERLAAQLISEGYEGIFAIEHFGAIDQLKYMEQSAEMLRAVITGGQT